MTRFYDFFANRHGGSAPGAIGAWNVRRRLTHQLRLLRECGALAGDCLEIGPGEGVFARMCRDAGMRYGGIERSPRLQRRLAEDGLDVTLGSAPPIEREDARFDLVCILAVLEHMASFEQALQLLHEAHRVLKPGGCVVVSVPDYLRGGIDFYAWDYTHAFVMTPLRLEQILGDCGFRLARTQHYTGSLSSSLARLPVDLAGFVVHSRFMYWLASGLGLGSVLFRFHKTFQPSIFVVACKPADAPSRGAKGDG